MTAAAQVAAPDQGSLAKLIRESGTLGATSGASLVSSFAPILEALKWSRRPSRRL